MTTYRYRRFALLLAVGTALSIPSVTQQVGAATAGPTVVLSAPTLDAAAAVARFRALLGPDNGGGPGGDPTGHREINWDGVPDEQAEPNGYVGDFFNAATAPRARGAVLRSVGGGRLAVSAREGNPAGVEPRFGNINPSYAAQFKTFSAERLFSPVGSTTVDLTFRVPGTSTPAAVRGFGAVYTDVDRAKSAAFRYYDVKGRLLGTYSVPAAPGSLSFLGVVFRDPVVARVRIVYGNRALGPDESRRVDVAVMDDFLYSEPSARLPYTIRIDGAECQS
jgi:hypothetical protein